MKPLILLIAFLSISAFAYENDSSHAHLTEILREGGSFIKDYMDKNLEIVKIDVDLITGHNKKIVLKEMSSLFKYGLICIGQDGCVKELQVYVWDMSMKHIIAQAANQRIVTTDFKPETSGSYIIEITARVEESCELGGYFFLLIGHN